MKFSRALCIVTTTMVSLSSTSFAQPQNTPGLRGAGVTSMDDGEGFPLIDGFMGMRKNVTMPDRRERPEGEEGFPPMGSRPTMGDRPSMGQGGQPGEGVPSMGNRPNMGGRPSMGGRPNMGQDGQLSEGFPPMGNRPSMGQGRPSMGEDGQPGEGFPRPGMGGRPNMGGRPDMGEGGQPGEGFPRPGMGGRPGLGEDGQSVEVFPPVDDSNAENAGSRKLQVGEDGFPPMRENKPEGWEKPDFGEGGFPRRACMRKCMNMTGWEKPDDWEKPEDWEKPDFDEVDSPRRECMRKCKNMTDWEKPHDWERPDFGQDGFPRRRFRVCMRKCMNRTEWEKPEDWEKPDFDKVDLDDVDSPRRACIRKCKNMTEWEKPEDWEMPGGWERPKFGEGDRPFMRKPGLDDPEVGEPGEEAIPSPPESDEGV